MIYIRTDMNEMIATGHVMRCLSIAEAAKSFGEDTTFILSDTKACELLKSKGIDYVVLGSKWDDLESETKHLCRLIKEKGIPRLLIDSYMVTSKYLEEINKATEVWYLDDLNKFTYPVKGIICYAVYFPMFKYEERYDNVELRLGPKYAPLRSEFADLPAKTIKGKPTKLLLLSGGTDKYSVTEKLLRIMTGMKWESIDAICGRYDSHYDQLVKKYSNSTNVHIHKSVSDVERFMKKADIAISAGGTTLYELCACGTPTISYAIADNQLYNVEQFDSDGIIPYAGDLRYEDVTRNVLHNLEILASKTVRERISIRMQAIVDGCGARRIAELLGS